MKEKELDFEKLTQYAVVIPNGAGKCLRYAADRLVYYMAKATEAELRIITNNDLKPKFGFYLEINIGGKNSGQSELKNDGFAINEENYNVHFMAETERGIMYAVYDFIEKCLNVRFLTADCEYCKRITKIILPNNYRSTPSIRFRTYLVGDTFQVNANQDQIAKTRVKDVFTEIDEQHGGKIEIYGRNIYHNFHFYVPFEIYGNAHPEFYRFLYINNEIFPTIDITDGITEDGQLDESREISVTKIVIEELKKDILNNPDVSVFTLTQEDGPYFFDSPNNRRLEKKYRRSGILVRFCNVILRNVNKWCRETLNGRTVKLATFAYDYTKEAPVTVNGDLITPIDNTVIADENLIIQFALFRNGIYSYFSDKQNKDIRKIMTEWHYIAKQFWFWGYDIDFSNYFAYYDSFDNIEENVRGFVDYGIDYLCIQGSHDSVKNWQCNIRAYAYRKLMWNSNLRADELIDEYIILYYGIAADAVRATMKLFHENYRSIISRGGNVDCTTFGNHASAENNPIKMINGAIAEIEKGEKLIDCSDLSENDKQKYKERLYGVKTTPLNIKYINFEKYFPNCSEAESVKARNDFAECVKAASVTVARERYSLEKYIDYVESEKKLKWCKK